MTTHLGSRHRSQRQRIAEPEMNTAAIKRRKSGQHQPYDDAAQVEFTWEAAQQPYSPAPVYAASDGQYAIVEPAYAEPAGPYAEADPDYAAADAPYDQVDAAYPAADLAYARPGARYPRADMAYGPMEAGDGAGPGGFGSAAAGYDADPGEYDLADAEFGGVQAGYGPPDESYSHTGAVYSGEPDDGYVTAEADYGDQHAGYAPAGDWHAQHDAALVAQPEPGPAEVYPQTRPDAPASRRDDRTAALVHQGRSSAAEHNIGRGLKITAIVMLAAGLLVGLVLLLLPGPGPTWPAGVAKVQGEVVKACQNPDVASEPGQVNFACAKSTRQILWVFSLLTSGDNPNFADARNGRVGLEPITPRQGGIVAWSLNLHHPYQPTNPIDSIQVAARAINNIIGGATVTGTYGNPVVQAGLESSPANCLRYTGSPKVNAHKGFPGLCARPISSVAGQAALVADVYQKWIVGADPKAAQNAATLYENARNPGSPEVQAILKHLPNSGR